MITASSSYHLLYPRRYSTPHTEPIAWLELAAAGLLALEGYHIWHRHHAHALATGTHRLHVLPWVYAATAVMYVGLALGASRLAGRRYLHLPATGFSGRLRLLGPAFQFEWAQVRATEAQGPASLLVYPLGVAVPQKLLFAHLLHGQAQRDRLLAHALTHLPAPGDEPGDS